jgi:hypothetical protein
VARHADDERPGEMERELRFIADALSRKIEPA